MSIAQQISENNANPQTYPAVLAPNFNQIPKKLRAGRYHVTWQPERRGTKIAKTPYIARAILETGRHYRASSTNPRSWSTFNQAQKAYHRGQTHGIGVALTTERRIVLVDIDHCIDQATETIHPAAQELIDQLNTYTEKSPSQEGIHIFPQATLPPNTRKQYMFKGLKVEIYASDRYSTLTGHRVADTPAEVEERQEQFNTMVALLETEEKDNTVCVCVCSPSDKVTDQEEGRPNPKPMR